MSRITRLGFALILAVTALSPGTTEAACTIEQCFRDIDCSQYVCPPGQSAFPRCSIQTCQAYCICRSF